MDIVYNLSTPLRMCLFSGSFILIAIMMYIFVFNIINNKRKKIINLTIPMTIFFTVILVLTRTPLLPDNDFIFLVLNYLITIPSIILFIIGIYLKRYIYIVDGIFTILNTPLFMFIPIWPYFYVVSVGFLLLRVSYVIFDIYNKLSINPGNFILKDALDSLEDGLIYANENDQIIYINPKMSNILQQLNIKEHLKVSEIVKRLLKIHIRRIDKDSIIVKLDDKYLNFYVLRKDNLYSQLLCMDVTREEILYNETNKLCRHLEMTNRTLEETLLDIRQLEHDKEVLRMKGALHDSMSQRLSILHCYMLENTTNNLKQIKSLIQTMLPDIYESIEISGAEKLDDIISSYKLIGVDILVKGKLPKDKTKEGILINIIRECTTNAIKHGKATKIIAEIKVEDDKTIMILSNNGINAVDIVEGNGIKNIRYQLSKVNGKLTYGAADKFVMLVEL